MSFGKHQASKKCTLRCFPFFENFVSRISRKSAFKSVSIDPAVQVWEYEAVSSTTTFATNTNSMTESTSSSELFNRNVSSSHDHCESNHHENRPVMIVPQIVIAEDSGSNDTGLQFTACECEKDQKSIDVTEGSPEEGGIFPLLTWKTYENGLPERCDIFQSSLDVVGCQNSMTLDNVQNANEDEIHFNFKPSNVADESSLHSIYSTPSPETTMYIINKNKSRLAQHKLMQNPEWLFSDLPFIDSVLAKQIKAIGRARPLGSDASIENGDIGNDRACHQCFCTKCGPKLSSCPANCLPCLKGSPASTDAYSKQTAGQWLRIKPNREPTEDARRRHTHTNDEGYWKQIFKTTGQANRSSSPGNSQSKRALLQMNRCLQHIHDQSKSSVGVTATEPDPSREPAPEDFFDFAKQLGTGSYGQVFHVRCRKSRIDLAMKIQKLSNRRMAEIEVQVLKNPNQCPFLVSLHSHFSTKSALYIVMEYVSGGRLTQKLVEPFSVVASAFYSAQIALALMHLHERGILYRDLKPDNVLLTEYNYIKLCDFGSCYLGCIGSKNATVSTGTPRYWAPEKLEQCSYGRPADWWSLGLILFQMLHGRFAFETTEPGYAAYMKEVMYSEPIYNPNLSEKALSACKGFLRKNPNNRLGGSEEKECILMHPFYTHFVNWEQLESQTAVAPPFYALRHSSLPAYMPAFRRSPRGHAL